MKGAGLRNRKKGSVFQEEDMIFPSNQNYLERNDNED